MRLRQHPLLKLILSSRCRAKFADYIHENYGSIMGNLCFGMLLGLTGVIGYLTGLPLDIRHVAFSSANVGYIAISGDFGWALSCSLVWSISSSASPSPYGLPSAPSTPKWIIGATFGSVSGKSSNNVHWACSYLFSWKGKFKIKVRLKFNLFFHRTFDPQKHPRIRF